MFLENGIIKYYCEVWSAAIVSSQAICQLNIHAGELASILLTCLVTEILKYMKIQNYESFYCHTNDYTRDTVEHITFSFYLFKQKENKQIRLCLFFLTEAGLLKYSSRPLDTLSFIRITSHLIFNCSVTINCVLFPHKIKMKLMLCTMQVEHFYNTNSFQLSENVSSTLLKPLFNAAPTVKLKSSEKTSNLVPLLMIKIASGVVLKCWRPEKISSSLHQNQYHFIVSFNYSTASILKVKYFFQSSHVEHSDLTSRNTLLASSSILFLDSLSLFVFVPYFLRQLNPTTFLWQAISDV